MDIRLIPNAAPSAQERAALDALLGPPATSWDGAEQHTLLEGHVGAGGSAAREQRDRLLPSLHAIQDAIGCVSPGALNYVCQRLSVPPAEAYGVASFYAMLALDKRAPSVAHVCDDIACRLRGGRELCAALEHALGDQDGGGAATWLPSPCLGLCEQAPAALIQRAGRGDIALAPTNLGDILSALADPAPATQAQIWSPGDARSAPQARTGGADAAGLRLLRRVGHVDPRSLDDYRASGGYEALREALALGPTGVLRELRDSRLVGRGGAAFPTARKWDDVARAPARPHYLVCNADESEPGTFKDRVLLEEDPFAVIEAMTIAGYTTGCELGYLYIRHEYPVATARLANAINLSRRHGFLGHDILGAGLNFDIELRRGAGAYICGEETALFNSIEGLRGEPRNKPPFPTQVGLFGKPTLVNNVETLVNVNEIVLQGGLAFAGVGADQSTGTKLFCVSGSVVAPGVYEAPFGVTLRDVLTLAGGTLDGLPPRAILLGGAAGSFVTADEMDTPLTFEGTRAIGASLGSGVIMVFDASADLVDTILRIAAFFRDESCGQCVPCRVGVVRQEEALRRLASGATIGSVDDELRLLDDVGQVMRDASICGLGQTAPLAVLSAITKLRLFDDKVPR